MVHDFVSKVDGFRTDIRDFLISPTRWRTTKVKTPLSWTSVKFEEAGRALVPAERGVYAFTVSHANDHFPPNHYVMYIGITGAKKPDRTLNKRFYDYMQEKKNNKRPAVCYMLNKYEDDLYFNYCPIAANIDLEQLELELNDAIIPPVVVKDFTAEIRQIVKAFRS
ncbi:hypothetical protein [Brevundimonas goettingensis]|uniref:GIY-YIG domain-containing protein n=1 Tax=Brevundimonas goettingensis TaxID=2774190 RepID=A0A975BYY1_9CAUL|nr:hypothetical protein [Brevundimonas goettingensis]QTC90328.1 hypothetical protein IFJ75_13720 [Brevundimonas goettingensis]